MKEELNELQKLKQQQLLHRQQMQEKREAIKRRKARTHRLIVRGAIAEKALSVSDEITDDEFQQQLYWALGKSSDDAPPSHPQDSCGSNSR